MSDLISRQKAKDAIDMALDHIDHVPSWVYDNLLNALNEVPSVKPTHPTPSNTLGALDCVERQAAIDALKICDNNEDGINCHKCPLRDERWDGAWQDDETNCYTKLMRDSAKLLEMPSAQPQKGKWIYGEHESAMCDGYRCDKCGFFVPWDYQHKFIDFIKDYNYCPSCGADMRGDDDVPESIT